MIFVKEETATHLARIERGATVEIDLFNLLGKYLWRLGAS
jgi:hypothetical protein